MKISRRKRKFVMLEQGEHWKTRTWHVIIATTNYKTRSATLLKRYNDSIHKENLIMRQRRQWNKPNWRERYVLNADRNSTRRKLSRSTWVQRMGENFPQSNNIIKLINWRGTDQMRPIKPQVKRRMSAKVRDPDIWN